MTWFPQTSAGSVAQFPLNRSRRWRTISNTLEGGTRITLGDPAAGTIEWRLMFQDLTDPETKNLTDLFNGSQGRFGSFGFVDPLANLIGWSEDISRPDWQAGLMQSTSGMGDPLSTQRALSISNISTGSQSLQQTIGVPGEYICCFSVYARSNAPCTISLSRDNHAETRNAGVVWSRIFLSGRGLIDAQQSTFSVTVAAGQALDLWGFQVEAQPYPSAYKQTSDARGIYEETYFGSDELSMTGEGANRWSSEIVLMSRV